MRKGSYGQTNVYMTLHSTMHLVHPNKCHVITMCMGGCDSVHVCVCVWCVHVCTTYM